jgi:hypothetical protein
MYAVVSAAVPAKLCSQVGSVMRARVWSVMHAVVDAHVRVLVRAQLGSK